MTNTTLRNNVAAKFASLFALMTAFALILTACGGGGEETETRLTIEQAGVQSTITYYAQGDEVTSQSTENIINYEAAGLGSKEEAEATFGPMLEQFQNIDGLEHSMEFGDEAATENLTVDFEVADIAEVSQLTGSSFDQAAEDGAKISLEQSVEMLEQAGYTVVE